jgi:hypothetical protein
MRLTKLVEKIINRKPWNYDGYRYNLKSIEDNGYYVQIEMNCQLPKKGQSYCIKKLESDFKDIMDNVSSILGVDEINYNVYFFVDGKMSEDVYINPEDSMEIRNYLKEESEIEFYTSLGFIKVKIKCYPSKRAPTLNYENFITFYIFYDIIEVKISDSDIKVKEEHFSDFCNSLHEILIDREFSLNIADEIYEIINDSLLIGTFDGAVDVLALMRNILGRDADLSSNEYVLKKEWFNF